jgi:hypothetical protein
MPEYKNRDGEIVDMESAMSLTTFTLSWVDAVIECTRRASGGDVWGLSRITKGMSVPHGSVSRLPSSAFIRSGSSHQYNTFDEAAREQIKPL